MNVVYNQTTDYNNPHDPEEGAGENVLITPMNMIGQIRQASNDDPYYHLVAHANGVPITWLVDSAAPVAMVGQAMARRIFGKNAEFIQSRRLFSDYNRNPVDVLGYRVCSLQAGNWRIENARIYVARENVSPVLGSEVFKGLGIRLAQIEKPEVDLSKPDPPTQKPPSTVSSAYFEPNLGEINTVTEESKEEVYSEKAVYHPDPEMDKLIHKHKKVFFENRRVIGHEVPLRLLPEARISQHKGRVIPIALQYAVDKEIRRLVADGHWKKISSCGPDCFISPCCITVNDDGSVQMAPDCTSLNENCKTLNF